MPTKTSRIILLLAALAACGPSGKTETIPALPSDGAATGDSAAAAAASNPWAGRDDLIKSPAPQPPSAVELPTIARFKLSNGLRVIVVESERLPLASVQLAIEAGRRDVELGKSGLEDFAAQMLTKGTRKRKGSEIAEAIDFTGGRLGASASHEATLVTCAAMSKDLDTCLELLTDVVINPTFPKEELEPVRKQLLAEVRQSKDDAGQLATIHFQNLLWGDEHIRGWPVSEASVATIAREDLVKWHSRWFKPNNAILAIAGNVDAASLKKRLESYFGRWKKGSIPKRGEGQPRALEADRVRVVDKPGQTQSHIRIGHYGIPHKDPTFYDTLVVNHVLGNGGFSSRLMQVIRSQAGKTYGASSTFDRSLDRGAFMAQTFTRTAETAVTIAMLRAELEKMAAGGPSEAELQDAITNITGSYATRFESAADVASAVLAAELHGFDESYVRDFALRIGEVSPASAQKAAAENLAAAPVAIVVVGDASQLAPQLEAAGLNFEVVGHLEPVVSAEREPELTALEPSKAARVAGEKLLAQAIAAKGGANKLASIKSLEVKARGTISTGKQEIPAELVRRFAAPDKLRLDVVIGGGAARITTAYNGSSGWIRHPQLGLQEIPADELVELANNVWRDHEFILLRPKRDRAMVAKLADEIIKGASYDVLAIIEKNRSTAVKLYLDKQTHLIARMDYTAQGLKGGELYTDYREVEGLQIAHDRLTINPESALRATVTEVKINGSVAAEVFEKPRS